MLSPAKLFIQSLSVQTLFRVQFVSVVVKATALIGIAGAKLRQLEICWMREERGGSTLGYEGNIDFALHGMSYMRKEITKCVFHSIALCWSSLSRPV